MQIWELKNEVMDLKESIKEEKEESTRLMGELGLNEYDSDEDQPNTWRFNHDFNNNYLTSILSNHIYLLYILLIS